MGRKSRVKPLPSGWEVAERWSVNGRWMEPGTEATVSGIRGRCVFIKAVTTDCGTALDFFDRDGHYRSVRPERVRRVHWTTKTRQRRDCG